MNKKLRTYRADEGEFRVLRQVAAARGLTVSETIRTLAAEEAQRLALADAPKPKRKPKYEPRIWRGDEIYNMEFPERKPRKARREGGEQ